MSAGITRGPILNMKPHSVSASVLLVLAVLISSCALPADARRLSAARSDGPHISSWTGPLLSSYLSNSQLEAWSLDFTNRCSSISRRFSIGKSVEGTDLWVIEIAAHPGKVEAKPNFKYVSSSCCQVCS
jgi:hypothetical protein